MRLRWTRTSTSVAQGSANALRRASAFGDVTYLG
jgi:hypothetical protein